MKRFYKSAVGVADPEQDGQYVIHLDGKPVQTPLRVPLSVPYEALAELVANEWQAQEEDVQPAMMPLTQISITAQD